ncbi:daughter-specific expression- protein [Varicellaria rhodocarpa]|nr:daughter-specific expression- protein [Varicellaria rhodocarpa]
MNSFAAVVVSLCAGLAIAQDTGSFDNLPPCGKVCVSNLLEQAASLGCSGIDVTCLCTKVNFADGVHDCAIESCASFASSLCNAAQASGATSTAAVTSISPSISQTSTVPSSSPSISQAITTIPPSLSTLTTTTAHPTISSPPLSSTPLSSTPSSNLPSSSTPLPTPTPQGLSKSTQIGLGVGISLGALVCIALGGFLVYYILLRRRRQEQTYNAEYVNPHGIERSVMGKSYGIDADPDTEVTEVTEVTEAGGKGMRVRDR